MGQTIAVIATVLNEAGAIEALLDSLAGQMRRPDEVIIVDGGSRDGTVERLHAWANLGRLPLHVAILPGANISQGRNAAIAATAAEIVACTDAGVRLEADWLANLVAPFEEAQPPDVAGGFFIPAPETLFERVLGATTLPALAEIDPATFAPS
jgi:glycosyltransferase involved in cell wall biosynthesis